MSDGPVGVIFDVGEETAVNGVDVKIRSFRLWDPKVDEGDRPMDGIVEAENTIEGRRVDTGVFGDRILTFDVPGQIMLQGGAVVFDQPALLLTWVQASGDVIIDRRGWGAIKGEIEVLDTIIGLPGDYIDLEAPHQVNAKVAQSPVTQRGGTRRVQIVGRTPHAGTATLQLEDAGNVAQTAPAPPADSDPTDPSSGVPIPNLALSASVDNPLTIATVTVTNVADITAIGGDVYLQYAVQVSSPTGDGTAWGPVRTSEGDDTMDLPPIASGGTIWVRGRTKVTATGRQSAWSTWISITLGPDTDGTGGKLAPFTLALQIDTAGVLSATANSVVAAITKIYFLAGAAGGAAPTYAAVLASIFVDASGPPFTASAIATMAEGETRTVGAIGEDALGNRTTLVTASITRAVDTGSGAGVPGNFRLTFHATPALVTRNVGAAAVEPVPFKPMRKYENTTKVAKARLQLGNHVAASAGTEIHLGYSLDGGTTPLLEAGPLVRVDRVNFPEPGAFAALVANAVGPNVLLGVLTKGGSGSTTVEIGNVWLDAVTGTPPDSPTGDPPGDLPTGGPYGNLVLDLNAFSLGLADNDPVSTWPDDSPSANNASLFAGQSAPVYKANGAGASKPSVRTAAATTQGMSYNVPAPLSQTRYIVMIPTTGLGSGGRSFDNGVIFSGHGASNIKDIGLGLRSDGKLAFSIGENAVVTTFRSTVTGASVTGAIHLICLVYDSPAARGQIFIDDMTTPAATDIYPLDGGLFDDYPTEFIGIGGSSAATSIAADYCRDTCWDAAHGATQRAAIKTILQAQWGTP